MSALRLLRRLRRRMAWKPKCEDCYHGRLTVSDCEDDEDYAGAAIAEGLLRAHERDEHPELARRVSP